MVADHNTGGRLRSADKMTTRSRWLDEADSQIRLVGLRSQREVLRLRTVVSQLTNS
jgi:hypothetical protein